MCFRAFCAFLGVLFLMTKLSLPHTYPLLWCKQEQESYIGRQRMAYRRYTCSISI